MSALYLGTSLTDSNAVDAFTETDLTVRPFFIKKTKTKQNKKPSSKNSLQVETLVRLICVIMSSAVWGVFCVRHPVTALLTFVCVCFVHEKKKKNRRVPRLFCVCWSVFFLKPSVNCMNETSESTKNWKGAARLPSGAGRDSLLGNAAAATATVIRRHWGKSNPPFWGSSTRSHCK